MIKQFCAWILLSGSFFTTSLAATNQECVMSGYRLESTEFGTLVVAADARGRFELMACTEVQIGARRFAAILARVKMHGVDSVQSNHGGWRSRVKLSNGGWMWLESPYGWLCDVHTRYPCSFTIFASENPEISDAFLELSVQSPETQIFTSPLEWLDTTVLSEIF